MTIENKLVETSTLLHIEQGIQRLIGVSFPFFSGEIVEIVERSTFRFWIYRIHVKCDKIFEKKGKSPLFSCLSLSLEHSAREIYRD